VIDFTEYLAGGCEPGGVNLIAIWIYIYHIPHTWYFTCQMYTMSGSHRLDGWATHIYLPYVYDGNGMRRT
jgi:hypothetical protein